MDRRIRASVAYAGWVERNRHPACLLCDSADDLEVHHVVDLRAVVVGVLRLHADPEDALAHAIAMHDDDTCEGVTLCRPCHDALHAGRRPRGAPSRKAFAPVQTWTAAPRVLWSPFLTGSRSDGPGLRLTAFQTLLGIGWYILNDHMDSRMVEFNRRRFAELLGKRPTDSFNHSLDRALRRLKQTNMLLASHRRANKVEIHISKDYLELLLRNPWFFPLREVATRNMCVLTLRLFLSTQGRRKTYRIGIAKLRKHLGMLDRDTYKTIERTQKACKAISWADMGYDKGICTFKLHRRPAVPIHTLRAMLDDAIQKGS